MGNVGAGRPRPAARTGRIARGGNARDARHHSSIASRADCTEMDLHPSAPRATGCGGPMPALLDDWWIAA